MHDQAPRADGSLGVQELQPWREFISDVELSSRAENYFRASRRVELAHASLCECRSWTMVAMAHVTGAAMVMDKAPTVQLGISDGELPQQKKTKARLLDKAKSRPAEAVARLVPTGMMQVHN